ncbi:MAG TPA: dethiobiotin synthase [Verrucomicrobiae bacterium]|jgi:dethiobiotin synthetase
MGNIIFVTGTDTGAGKTVLTAMLLVFLRSGGGNALGMKPFCSGSRGDARLLHVLQGKCLTLEEVNPFYFDKPLAPAAAGPAPPLAAVLKKIRLLARRCDALVVEGAGGLLAPLGRNYTARDIISRLKCKTMVVCVNKLGVINHVLLTAESLQHAGIKEFTIVMMSAARPGLSACGNPCIIRQKLPGIPILCVPNLGRGASKAKKVEENAKYLKKTLAQVLGHDNLITFFRK